MRLVRALVQGLGPSSAATMAGMLGLTESQVEAALAQLELAGIVLQGEFLAAETITWCERRILQRIHRLTLGRLREEIRPVTPAELVRFLLRWQHVQRARPQGYGPEAVTMIATPLYSNTTLVSVFPTLTLGSVVGM